MGPIFRAKCSHPDVRRDGDAFRCLECGRALAFEERPAAARLLANAVLCVALCALAATALAYALPAIATWK